MIFCIFRIYSRHSTVNRIIHLTLYRMVELKFTCKDRTVPERFDTVPFKIIVNILLCRFICNVPRGQNYFFKQYAQHRILHVLNTWIKYVRKH